MGTLSHNVVLATSSVIDPMGSIIINTNTTFSPSFSWVYENTIKAVGLPDFSNPLSSNFREFKNANAWKIKYLENIPKSSGSGYIGSFACLTNPSSPSCEGGPYKILGRRYYIDFFVVYAVNLSVPDIGEDQSLYYLSGPLVAVDVNRCTPDYGIFLAVPKVLSSETSYPTATSQSVSGINVGMLSETIYYSNQLKFNQNINYKLTVLDETGNFMDDVVLTTENIVLALENAIMHGQTSIMSVNSNNNGIILYPQPNDFPNSYNTKSYYPVVVFRYISENSSTTNVNLAFSISLTI